MKTILTLGLILSFLWSNAQCSTTSPYALVIAEESGDPYSWYAALYDLSQIGNAGDITSITFKIDNPSYVNETYTNQKLYMRNTSTSDYTSSSSFPGTSGFTLVWSGTLSFASVGYTNLDLDLPFYYNGTDQLEILLINNSGNTPSSDINFIITEVSSTVYNSKFGTGYSLTAAESNCVCNKFSLAIGFNTKDDVNCNSYESTLPIVLGKITAKQTENKSIQIDWTTLTEINNDYFVVQRSYDANNFENIGKITGAGNSNTKIDYQFTDNYYDKTQKNIYYRIKQVDYNSDYSISKIISVHNTQNNNLKIIYSNQNSSITIQNNTLTTGNLSIYNNKGQIVYQQKNTKNNFKINTSNFEKGVYLIKYTSNSDIKTKRFCIY